MVDVLERPREVVDKEQECLVGEIVVDQVEGNRNWGSRKTLPMGAYDLSGHPGKRLVIHTWTCRRSPDQAEEKDKQAGEGGKYLILETYKSQ